MPSLGRSLLALIIAILAASPADAGSLPVSVVSLTSPVAPFTDATIHVRTAPAAACRITVIYKSGPSRAKGLVPMQASAKGDVVWRWRVGSNTTPGHWPIKVACEKASEVGQLETAIEVRR